MMPKFSGCVFLCLLICCIHPVGTPSDSVDTLPDILECGRFSTFINERIFSALADLWDATMASWRTMRLKTLRTHLWQLCFGSSYYFPWTLTGIVLLCIFTSWLFVTREDVRREFVFYFVGLLEYLEYFCHSLLFSLVRMIYPYVFSCRVSSCRVLWCGYFFISVHGSDSLLSFFAGIYALQL